MSTAERQDDSQATFNRCVRIREVKAMTGMSHSTIYKYIAAGQFPKPIKLGLRMAAWRVSTIEAWIADRERR
jgi:prophage regulatory protein